MRRCVPWLWRLSATELAPDVEQDHERDEEEGGHEHGGWADLEARGVVGVETKDTGAGADTGALAARARLRAGGRCASKMCHTHPSERVPVRAGDM